jgi:chitodextrinase
MLEDWANAAGQRKFDVRIEGTQVLTAFDIFASCGAYTACDRTFTTTVSDGQLNIQFNMNGGANYGTVSAIQVTGSGGGGDTTPPSAPTGLSSPSHTSSSVSLSWTAATDNVGVTGYQVLRNGAQVGTSTSTSYTDSGLAASTSYSYTVKATDAAGNVSAASSALSVTTSAGTSTNVALNKPATASSTENSTFPASNAVDGNASTRWSSAFSDPQWLRVDLGQTYAISRVTLTWEAAYGKAYQIQTSPDGTKLVNWANANHIGYLGFWSIARDNGGCSNVVSPTCSSSTGRRRRAATRPRRRRRPASPLRPTRAAAWR